MPRAAELTRTLAQLADTLVDDFDLVELLTMVSDRCVDVLGVSAAGLMLVEPEGDLRVVASSNEAMRLVELFELQSQEGPCLDSFRTGAPVLDHDLDGARARWPRFVPVALDAGFRTVHAFPLRLRGQVLGALNLFDATAVTMHQADARAAQALADLATVAVVQNQAVRRALVVNDQLTHALESRVVIEQAKGVLAERLGVDMAHAFAVLRNHARNHNLRLAEVARAVVAGRLATDSLDVLRP
jgi:transcriptional regulator with GAF, ATPase, and Fis domain